MADLSRLLNILNTSGIQKDNNALYQTVVGLIKDIQTTTKSLQDQINTLKAGASSIGLLATNKLVASPGGIANNAGLMLGLGATITPQTTGRLLITISGVVAQSTTADGASWHIRTGAGAAPANGGALVGTQSGGQQSMTFLTGVLSVPFSINTIVSGLTIGTGVWIDLVLATITGGTATMTQVMVTAVEI